MAKTGVIEWLKSAFFDLITIEEIINNDMLTHIVAFHSQQAIEKSFKAILEYQDKKIIKDHDLIRLYDLIGLDFEIDKDILDLLNELYIDSRYPGHFGLLPNGKPSLMKAKKFYNEANNIFDKVCEITKNNKNFLIKKI